MMTDYEFEQDVWHREAEGKLIACISKLSADGLISSALRIYLENPWMTERIFSSEIHSEADIDALIDDIISDTEL